MTLDLVLVHAFPLDASMWEAEVRALAPRSRVIAPDLPGFGAAPLGDARDVDDYAAAVVAAMDRAGLRRAAVCGLSMGGYVAFALWRRHRARVAALVLADTRAEADPPEAAERRRAVAEAARRGGGPWMADQLPPLLGPRASDGLRARVRSIARAQAGEAIARASLALAARPDSTATLRTISVPAAIVVGADDAITPPSAARAMADAIAGARYVEIAGAGHLSNLERPDAFQAVLRDVLG